MKSQMFLRGAALILAFTLSFGAQGQSTDPKQQSSKRNEALKLSGPRIGGTYLHNYNPSETTRINMGWEDDNSVPTALMLFGWNFEWNYFQTADGSQGLIQVMPLIAGFDQGLFLPSVSALMGYRHSSGWEIGFGPTAGVTSLGFVSAIGYTFRNGEMNFPINLAITPTKESTRISLTVGWSMN